MECDGMKWKKMKRVRIRNTGATPPPLPPPLAPAQATPSPSYHSFGARQPPHCTRPYVPHGYTRATATTHRTWYLPSKKCKSFVPFTSNFPLAHTPHRLTNLAPQGNLDKFFFFFFSFSFSSRTGAGQRRSQHHCCLLPSRARRPPLLAHHYITRGKQANLPPHCPVTHQR